MATKEQDRDRADEPRSKVPRQVVVTGDVTIDWNLARTRQPGSGHGGENSRHHIETYSGPGGAALLAQLIEEVGRRVTGDGPPVRVLGPTCETVSVAPGDPALHHSYALWSEFPRRLGDRGPSVWRVAEFLGVDRGRVGPAAIEAPAHATGPGTPDIVVIDDANLGFRDHPSLWPPSLSSTDCSQWVLLKMAAPIADGPLWRHLLRDHAKQLIVVMTLDDLRLSDIKISRELSWERTAGDLARELVLCPAVNGLALCAYVVLSLGTGGAVLLTGRASSNDGPLRLNPPDCEVFFDPESIEDSWAEQYPGALIGNTACLVTAIARELMIAPDAPDLHNATGRGLAAGRALHLAGYGTPDSRPDHAGLAFPTSAIVQALEGDATPFATARIEQPVRDSWSILQSRYPEGLETLAEILALEGVESALPDVPLGIFGKLLTVDRGEIEGFRSLRTLMREYDSEPAPRPLNLAVFGPPGAGKSFGIKAVAKSSLGGRVEDMTFNLSQMKDAEDLADALHQVRDAGLRGKLPLVLWDEFDSELAGTPLGWLRHFLAPMQDGAFQQGQVLHPVGKAIFVFAGGTSSRLADFAQNRSDEFRLAKGPDFVSRLKGHVDIVGPDPRDGDPEADPYFRVRRAILLRSMLLRDRPGLFAREGRSARLQIDPGVLRALLGVASYRHGARSLETILSMSTLHGADRYERSALPAADQLDAHVDAREFLEAVERYIPEGDLLDRLAEAIHVSYCKEMLDQGHAWASLPTLVDWSQLPEHLREMNRDAARDLSDKLGVLGFVLCRDFPAGLQPVLVDPKDPRVEQLAKHEHERWMRRKEKSGWRYGDPRDDARRLHPSMRPWDQLPESEREKDHLTVLDIPRVVEAAGLTLAQIDGGGDVAIGVTGHRFLAEIERVAGGIEAALDRITQAHPGKSLKIVSALAEGADRLVAKQALKRAGARLVAVLPLPKYDYLADFESRDSKDEFLRLLGTADEVIELPARSDRVEAYAAAADEIVERAETLLAIWDGANAQGHGGTAEAVTRARESWKPIAWVHAANRRPGGTQPRSLGAEQGRVTYENFERAY